MGRGPGRRPLLVELQHDGRGALRARETLG